MPINPDEKTFQELNKPENLVAKNNWILVDPIDLEEATKTKTGILYDIKSQYGIKPTRGKVISIGDKAKEILPDLKVGDWVMYVYLLDVWFGDRRYYFVKAEDIKGIFKL